MNFSGYTVTYVCMGYGRSRKLAHASAIRCHERRRRNKGTSDWAFVGVSFMKNGVAWLCTLTVLADK